MAEEDLPPSPPQGRGAVILLLCHPDRAIATRDLVVAYMEKIILSYSRQNDRVEDSPPDKNQKIQAGL